MQRMLCLLPLPAAHVASPPLDTWPCFVASIPSWQSPPCSASTPLLSWQGRAATCAAGPPISECCIHAVSLCSWPAWSPVQPQTARTGGVCASGARPGAELRPRLKRGSGSVCGWASGAALGHGDLTALPAALGSGRGLGECRGMWGW